PFPLIDLIAILPFYLSSLFALDLRFMRIFRLIRIFRLAHRSSSLSALGSVIKKESHILFAALVVMVVLLFTSSSLMYYLERDVQPEKFGNIPLAMWWGIAALTTVGFGDSVPHSDAGKLLAGVVMLFGIMVFALPTGIIASGLVREIRGRSFINTWKLVARVPILRNLDALQIASLVEILQPRFAREGQVLWAEGEKADRMYFIVSGVVEVQRGGETIEISSGEFCGEMALLFGRRRKAHVRAKTYCELLALEA
ncbi:MAG: cyclic nucleotide-binding domain-containing protein, partial [bacterium]|nr:cyclic nucleotide-binding domain-containing protein [bacterium]